MSHLGLFVRAKPYLLVLTAALILGGLVAAFWGGRRPRPLALAMLVPAMFLVGAASPTRSVRQCKPEIVVMADRVTANLPSRDLDKTAAFYQALGFRVGFKDDGWMILNRGALELEFFPMPDLNPKDSWFSACFRVDDLDALYADFQRAGLPDNCRDIPRLNPPADEHGLRMFALIDLDGSLIRCIDNRSTT